MNIIKTPISIINASLFGLRNVNGFSFGVVEPIHSLYIGQHGEAPEAHQGEEQGDQEPDPQSDAHQFPAFPSGPELTITTHLENLQLDVREGQPEFEVFIGGTGFLGHEHAGVSATEGGADGGGNGISAAALNLKKAQN